MSNQFSRHFSSRPFAVAIGAAMLAGALLVAPAARAQKGDKNHRDAFMRGSADENTMAQKVRHELLMLPYYGVFDDIAFRIDGNTVTLLGAVTRPTLKSDAEGVVKKVAGVEQVVNQIEVLPLSSMDDGIRRAEYRAIYGDPTLSTRYGFSALPSIHIIVKNGAVTLEGVVANKGDRDLITLRANSVPNVFSVKNELQLEQGS